MDKAALLDTVQDASGTVVPDLDLLKTVTDTPETVIAMHCEHCGSTYGLHYPEAEQIFLALQQPLEFSGKYLVASSCKNCKGDKNISLKSF